MADQAASKIRGAMERKRFGKIGMAGNFLRIVISLIIGLFMAQLCFVAESVHADPVNHALAEYSFENNVNDSSGKGNHGTVHGTVTYEDGYAGKGAVFDGATGYIELPRNLLANHTDFTISLMLKTTSSGAILGYQDQPALTTVASISNWIPILYVGTDGKMYANFWNGTSAQKISSAGAVNDGVWHKAALSVGANSIRLYIDGLLIGEKRSEVDHLNMDYNQLGVADNKSYSSSNNNWFYYSGMLDEFRVVEGSYTIAAISNQTASPLTAGYASGDQELKSVSIANTGTGNLTNVAVSITGTDFELTQPLTTTINRGDPAAGFTVKAKDGLAPGTYTATVTVSADDMTDVKFTVTQTVILLVPPDVPHNLAAAGGNRQVTLNWSSVTEATYYQIYMGTTQGQYGNASVATVTYTTYDVSGLTNGTMYYFTVKAGNSAGLSAESASASAIPATVPAAPADVAAVAGNGQATISFAVPADNGGSAITGYVVSASADNITVTGTASPITVTGLTNGKSYTFTVRAVNAIGDGLSSADSAAVVPFFYSSSSGGGSAPSAAPEPANTGVNVLVNGKAENAGTAAISNRNNQTVTTIVIDQKKLEDKLAAEGQHTVVTIFSPEITSDVVIGEINGQMVKNMETKQAVLQIKTDQATYSLPAQLFNIDAISDQVGKSVALQDIKVQIEIAVPAADALKAVGDAAEKGSYTLVAPPVDFTARAVYGGVTISISKFNAYVERAIAIPDGTDPGSVTTGVVVEPDGKVHHVPTKVLTIDGKHFAVINSLTNSTYSLIKHPLAFNDTANHWAKDAINDMGSRMVIDGTGGAVFAPDKEISRAEFAAIIVRGLGLKPERGTSPFPDVKASDWYSDVINTAYAYHLIGGFEDGTFRPNGKITREEAMTIIAEAMKWTKLKDQLSVPSTGDILRPFSDAAQASSWAQSGIAASVGSSIVSGRSGTQLAPKDYITRAETAVMIQRLLKQAELI